MRKPALLIPKTNYWSGHKLDTLLPPLPHTFYAYEDHQFIDHRANMPISSSKWETCAPPRLIMTKSRDCGSKSYNEPECYIGLPDHKTLRLADIQWNYMKPPLVFRLRRDCLFVPQPG